MGWTDVRSAGMTALRRVRSAAGGAVVVLTYHRVAEAGSDPEGITVTPARFAEHVASFASRYELVTAGELGRRLVERTALPRNGVCITLDDGYADALSAALPVLSEHAAPATVFACSGYLDEPREFWWDELERLVLLPTVLPERLEIVAAHEHFTRELPGGTVAAEATRRQLHRDLSDLIEPLPSGGREEVLRQVREQTGQERSVRADKRPLSADELRVLADSGLVEIGAHTVNHVRLGSLALAGQRDEIVGSKRRLEELLDRPVESFSYPYGTRGAFSAETQRLVRDAGFVSAVTAGLGSLVPWGSVYRGSDRFALPRTATADVPAAELTALIDRRLGL